MSYLLIANVPLISLPDNTGIPYFFDFLPNNFKQTTNCGVPAVCFVRNL